MDCVVAARVLTADSLLIFFYQLVASALRFFTNKCQILRRTIDPKPFFLSLLIFSFSQIRGRSEHNYNRFVFRPNGAKSWRFVFAYYYELDLEDLAINASNHELFECFQVVFDLGEKLDRVHLEISTLV